MFKAALCSALVLGLLVCIPWSAAGASQEPIEAELRLSEDSTRQTAVTEEDCAVHDGNCTTCTENVFCGYCRLTGRCQLGSVDGSADETCVSPNWNYGTCPEDYNCGKYEICRDCWMDGSCDDCPYDRPVRCPSGVCVDAASQCPLPERCTPTSNFKCKNGTCTDDANDCYDDNCPGVRPYVCYDGTCVDDTSKCEPFPVCSPFKPLRCTDGKCYSSSSTCDPIEESCDTSRKRCPDGVCRNINEVCPPSNRCPADSPFQCGDGVCRLTESQCRADCARGNHRCYNGACLMDGFACPPPLRTERVLHTVTTIDATVAEDMELEAFGDELTTGVLCSVKLTANDIGLINAAGAGNEFTVGLRQYAENLLETVDNAGWWPEGTGYQENLFSAVFVLDWPAAVEWPLADLEATVECLVENEDIVEPSNICLGVADEENGFVCVDNAPSFVLDAKSQVTATARVSDLSKPLVFMRKDTWFTVVLVTALIVVGSAVVFGGVILATFSARDRSRKKREAEEEAAPEYDQLEARNVLQLSMTEEKRRSRTSMESDESGDNYRVSARASGKKKKQALGKVEKADDANYQSVSRAVSNPQTDIFLKEDDPFASKTATLEAKNDPGGLGMFAEAVLGLRKQEEEQKAAKKKARKDKKSKKSKSGKSSGGKKKKKKKSTGTVLSSAEAAAVGLPLQDDMESVETESVEQVGAEDDLAARMKAKKASMGKKRAKTRVLFEDEPRGTTRSKRVPVSAMRPDRLAVLPPIKARATEVSEVVPVKLPRQKVAAGDDQYADEDSSSSYDSDEDDSSDDSDE